MYDRFHFRAPLGLLGRVAAALVLKQHLTRFLRARADALKAMAESDDWRRFLGNGA